MSDTQSLPKFCGADDAARLTTARLAPDAQFAVVRNPAYIYPPYEIYPMAPAPALPLRTVRAVVCDMDGTTTTTEPLCLHSLEFMVRRITGQLSPEQWAGLDHTEDYPHVIGNSTTRHIEYLLTRYGSGLAPEAYVSALIEGALWTIAIGRDDGRREEARAALVHLGLGFVLADPEWQSAPSLESLAEYGREQAARHVAGFHVGSLADQVRGAVEIYYARYHQILQAIARGEGEAVGRAIFGAASDARLIKPMPGIELFLVLLRGWLSDEEAGAVFDVYAPTLGEQWTEPRARALCIAMARHFRAQPAKCAVVTSSIRYEAEIVLGELFAQLRHTAERWPVSPATRTLLSERMESPQAFYDAMITASDSTEIRLKPHRDLYSIALHRLGLGPDQFGEVLGIEDSESGLIAIRTAGVGMAIAVPFTDTMGHNLDAAFAVKHGGLPELMFTDGLYLGNS